MKCTVTPIRALGLSAVVLLLCTAAYSQEKPAKPSSYAPVVIQEDFETINVTGHLETSQIGSD